MLKVLYFLTDIIVNNLLSNYFVHFRKIVESKNAFQSFFYFLILIRDLLIILLKNYFFRLICDIYQFFIQDQLAVLFLKD